MVGPGRFCQRSNDLTVLTAYAVVCSVRNCWALLRRRFDRSGRRRQVQRWDIIDQFAQCLARSALCNPIREIFPFWDEHELARASYISECVDVGRGAGSACIVAVIADHHILASEGFEKRPNGLLGTVGFCRATETEGGSGERIFLA